MTWLVMIGLPCWAIVAVIRSVLRPSKLPRQSTSGGGLFAQTALGKTVSGWTLFGKSTWGKVLFDYRPLLVVPVAAVIVIGKMSLASVWVPCPPAQAGCLRAMPSSTVPAKAQRAMKSASADTAERTVRQR